MSGIDLSGDISLDCEFLSFLWNEANGCQDEDNFTAIRGEKR